MTDRSADIRQTLLHLVQLRGAGKTICPSEVARALDKDWRPLMDAVRQTAAALQADGIIVVTQKGRAVDPLLARGPIRLGLPVKE